MRCDHLSERCKTARRGALLATLRASEASDASSSPASEREAPNPFHFHHQAGLLPLVLAPQNDEAVRHENIGRAVQSRYYLLSVYRCGQCVSSSSTSTSCVNNESGSFLYEAARQERSEHQVRMRALASRALPAWDCVERAGLILGLLGLLGLWVQVVGRGSRAVGGEEKRKKKEEKKKKRLGKRRRKARKTVKAKD